MLLAVPQLDVQLLPSLHISVHSLGWANITCTCGTGDWRLHVLVCTHTSPPV